MSIEILESKPMDTRCTDSNRIDSLELQPKEWDWFAKENHASEAQIVRALRSLEKEDRADTKLQLLLLLSQFANEHTPWSDSTLAKKVTAIPTATVQQLLPEFISNVRTKLLTASPKTTNDRTPRASKNRGLRPTLGYSKPTSEIDGMRKKWKVSADLFSLGSVCLWMHFDSSPESVSIMAAFALNVIDDADPAYRIQGCYLILNILKYGHYPILERLGLAQLFKEELETCLTFLPRLTPGDVSLRLMESAYPCLVELTSDEMTLGKSKELARKYLPYLEILDKHILGLISHIQGHREGPSNLVLVFLLRFGTQLIDTRIGAAALACYSRLNAMMCRLITDPFLVDSEHGYLVVEMTLDLQRAVTEAVMNAGNGSYSLLLEYKFDLLTSWTVFLKRVIRYDVGSERSRILLKTNLQLLVDIANEGAATSRQFQTAVQEIIENNPETKDFYGFD